MNRQGPRPGPLNLITDVTGIKVGQAEDEKTLTGTTVILPDKPVIGAVSVMGGAPGTRETEALDPSRLLGGVIDALTLSGGSVYGLETPPYRALGVKAVETTGEGFALGNAGAGYGAQAGRLKGGIGSASLVFDNGLQMGALMAVNAFGSAIVPGTASFWAAPFEIDNEFGGKGVGALQPGHQEWQLETKADAADAAGPRENTTIEVVATNAVLSAAECYRVAIMAHNGLARALRPAHAPVDGDVIFVLSTGAHELDEETRIRELTAIGTYAGDCVARSIARGVYEAESLGGMPGYQESAAG